MTVRKSHSAEWKERRRWRALELKRDGWTHEEVAETLGITKGVVSRWMKRVAAQGDAGLRARPHAGAAPKLTAEQRARLPEFLSHGAQAYGFLGELWTCQRVAGLIRREFNVSYHKDNVGRLLKQLRWTPQKPIERAAQRDKDQIARWRGEIWPALKKKRPASGAGSVFIDEAAFYLLPGVVRTYAPCGETPVLRGVVTRDHWSVMSGVTPSGQLFSLRRDHPLTSWESILFLCHLRRMIGTDLLAIWDGAPIHRSDEVKTFLAQGGTAFVHLEQLPAYAPELNPDEGVWQRLKNVELRNLWCDDLTHLSSELTLAMRRLRNKPELIQSFFVEAGLEL